MIFTRMLYIRLFFSFFILFVFTERNLYAQNNYINTVIPTVVSEAEYVWMNVKDISFFQQNNYSVSFPDIPIFMEELFDKSKTNSLTDSDYDILLNKMESSVYNQSDYNEGMRKIEKSLPVINQVIQELYNLPVEWQFKIFSPYKVNLTLYGPGGSYDPDTGNILLMTTPNGNFKGYSDPAYTIIHEIIHLGIEKSIIEKYGLSHQQKERLVDLFVLTYFGELLPGYQLQDFGDKGIDPYFSNKQDFIQLPRQIEKFVNNSEQNN